MYTTNLSSEQVLDKSSIQSKEKQSCFQQSILKTSLSVYSWCTSLTFKKCCIIQVTGSVTLIFEITSLWIKGLLFSNKDIKMKWTMIRPCVKNEITPITGFVHFLYIMSLFMCKQTLKRALAKLLIIGITMIDFFCSLDKHESPDWKKAIFKQVFSS